MKKKRTRVLSEVRIREVFKRITHKSKISGHEWVTPGPTTGYEIVGPTGVVDKARTLKSAEKKLAEWKEYFTKFPVVLHEVYSKGKWRHDASAYDANTK